MLHRTIRLIRNKAVSRSARTSLTWLPSRLGATATATSGSSLSSAATPMPWQPRRGMANRGFPHHWRQRQQWSVLERTEDKLAGGMRDEPVWYEVMKRHPPPPWLVGEKPQELEFPEDKLRKKLLQREPFLRLELARKHPKYDRRAVVPVSRVRTVADRFAERQCELMTEEGMGEDEAYLQCMDEFEGDFKDLLEWLRPKHQDELAPRWTEVDTEKKSIDVRLGRFLGYESDFPDISDDNEMERVFAELFTRDGYVDEELVNARTASLLPDDQVQELYTWTRRMQAYLRNKGEHDRKRRNGEVEGEYPRSAPTLPYTTKVVALAAMGMNESHLDKLTGATRREQLEMDVLDDRVKHSMKRVLNILPPALREGAEDVMSAAWYDPMLDEFEHDSSAESQDAESEDMESGAEEEAEADADDDDVESEIALAARMALDEQPKKTKAAKNEDESLGGEEDDEDDELDSFIQPPPEELQSPEGRRAALLQMLEDEIIISDPRLLRDARNRIETFYRADASRVATVDQLASDPEAVERSEMNVIGRTSDGKPIYIGDRDLADTPKNQPWSEERELELMNKLMSPLIAKQRMETARESLRTSRSGQRDDDPFDKMHVFLREYNQIWDRQHERMERVEDVMHEQKLQRGPDAEDELVKDPEVAKLL